MELIKSILWLSFAVGIVLWLRTDIRLILTAFRRRIIDGAGLKVGAFEIEGSRIDPSAKLHKSGIVVSEDAGQACKTERRATYDKTRGAMIVHRIFRSTNPRHLFDIEIYIIPHKEASLAGVTSVSYFFGAYGWENKLYTSSNRFNGFAITTAAYGPTLCLAKIKFSDGETVVCSRYLDFEMGAFSASIDGEVDV